MESLEGRLRWVAEIPISNGFSLVPRYISSYQGHSKQHMLSISNKVYMNASSYQNWVQLSFFGKFSDSSTTDNSFHTYFNN